MEIEVEITRKDFVSYNAYFFYRKRIRQRIITILVVSVFLSVIVNYGHPVTFTSFLVGFILAAAIFTLFTFGLGYLFILATGSIPAKNGSVLGKRKYKITDAGLAEESATNSSIQKWEGIKSVEENRDLIFVFTDKIAGYLIPKRSFRNQEEMEQFVGMIKEKTGQIK